ncbi:MAG: hypothetical protein Q9170_006002 [Blastenia crenularia]
MPNHTSFYRNLIDTPSSILTGRTKRGQIKERFIELVFFQSTGEKDWENDSTSVNNWQKAGRPWFKLIRRFGAGILLLLPDEATNRRLRDMKPGRAGWSREIEEGGDTEPVEREVDSSSAFHPSDGWILEEKGGNQSLPSTPPNSIASSEPRLPIQISDPLREERIFHFKSPFSRCDSVKPLADGASPCELSDRDSSAGKTQGDRWNDKEAAADDDEEEDLDGENDKNDPQLLRPVVKRSVYRWREVHGSIGNLQPSGTRSAALMERGG